MRPLSYSIYRAASHLAAPMLRRLLAKRVVRGKEIAERTRAKYICITNTESIYHGRRRQSHGDFIRGADYSLCDGVGVIVAAKAAGAAASKPLHWYVPLGMAAWFHDAGVRDVTELDWWEEASHGGVRVACTPAQHWSARTPFDKNTTLWSSWYEPG